CSWTSCHNVNRANAAISGSNIDLDRTFTRSLIKGKWKWRHLRDRVHQLTLGGHTLSVLPAHLTGATVRYPGYGHRHSVSGRRYPISRTCSGGQRHLSGWTNDPIICAHRVGHPAGRYRYG